MDRNDATSGSGGGGFGGRIASWAGPVNVRRGWADEDEDSEEDSRGLSGLIASMTPSLPGNGKEKERARFDSLVRVVDGEGRFAEEEMEEEGSEEEEDDDDDEHPMRRFWRREKVVEEERESMEDWEIDEQEEEKREITRRRAMRAVAKGVLKR